VGYDGITTVTSLVKIDQLAEQMMGCTPAHTSKVNSQVYIRVSEKRAD
jgi:hypothetical protein